MDADKALKAPERVYEKVQNAGWSCPFDIIRRFLEAGIMAEGVCIRQHEGTPQGGPLSPLLANILLDDWDKELERRGHCFCRYAHDCNIYVASGRAGERVLASVTQFLEKKLRLKVNRDKSAIAHPEERKFLGYRLSCARVAPKSVQRMKDEGTRAGHHPAQPGR